MVPLTLWASACVGPHGFPTFSRVGAAPSTWVPLLWPGCVGILPPCSFGMWSPFRVIVSFVTIDRQRRFPLEGFFLLGGSLPFRSGVVVSLRPLSVCHGSLWLVTALFTYLSLSLPVPIFPGFCCCFARCLGCAALLSLWLCAHLRLGQGFSYASCLPFALLWALGILVPVASLLHLGFPAFAMGSPLRGRGLFVLDRNEGLVSPFGSGTLDSSWLALQPLSAGFCTPCSSGSVARWSSLCPYPSVILSSLQGSSLSLSVTSPTLARSLGLSFVPYSLFCRLGLVPRSVAQLCALQLLVPSPGIPLWGCGFWGILGSLHCAPLTVGLLPGSPTLICLLSAGCLLGLETSPSGEASASSCRFSWRPGAAGALAVTLPEAASQREFSLSAWSFPFRGLSLFLAFVPLLEALSESLTHSIPRFFLMVGLVRFCGGLC